MYNCMLSHIIIQLSGHPRTHSCNMLSQLHNTHSRTPPLTQTRTHTLNHSQSHTLTHARARTHTLIDLFLSALIEVLHNLFEAKIDLFRYPTTGRRAICKFEKPHTLIVHFTTICRTSTTHCMPKNSREQMQSARFDPARKSPLANRDWCFCCSASIPMQSKFICSTSATELPPQRWHSICSRSTLATPKGPDSTASLPPVTC